MKNDLQLECFEYLPLRDVVFETLRKAILTGTLEPGERLREVQLAERLGVSRTPVREAIRKLELEGLVSMVPRRGAEVARITDKNLRDVLEVRRHLDALCAELACARINEEQIGRLRNSCDEFERAVRSKDLDEIARRDVEFHDVILEATKNTRLIQLVHNLSEQMYRFRFEYIKNAKMHEMLIREHRTICESIASGEVEKASQAAKLHIDNQEKAVLEHLHMEVEA